MTPTGTGGAPGLASLLTGLINLPQASTRQSGDELEIVPRGREATIRPVAKVPWLRHVGSLTGVWPAGHLDALRDEWDRSRPVADVDRTA